MHKKFEFLSKTFSEKEILKAGKFLLGLAAYFIALSFLVSLVPLELVEFFFASVSLFFLGFFGFSGELVFTEPVIMQLQGLEQGIAITYLCTGLLELVLLVSAVASSFGIEWKKRIIGVIAGAIALVAFNVFRIVSSILIILWFGLEAGGFSHDLLFRVFLFATVAGYYFVWFNWATRLKKLNSTL
ncbi:MAG: exosortase/archaeosortase family protein [Candidatus Diapherotrites archaeon]|uniref:Exosortase/archaeosortase family protein n=1 Tax=Candidatus Iainarchaeum sp. TaxID=3101447 RepID=A0A7J4J1C0_9ARCH|nr:MAG: hypothetical protein QT03_C0001G0730 [archaeon GW2011_AR10]MBS3059424.1 exosortase/archaeosortase family protein [Candidatus Diapherotrites archaeon]HIH09016.1 exosortase/archaeosortase family protein [Candidatus Diapherotrites archaeon]